MTNARLILGYSSVAQLGFITLGIFAFDAPAQGAQGALLQAVNHGLVVAPLFFVIALLAERAGGSEDIRDLGGIAFRAPVLAALFLIVALATLAMPGSANFAGEFLILLGVVQLEAGDRAHRLDRRRPRLGVRAADVHPRDAQPRRADGDVVRPVAARRARARAAGAGDPGVRALPAAGADDAGAARRVKPTSRRAPCDRETAPAA